MTGARIMQILALEHETGATTEGEHRATLRQEAEQVWALQKRGVVRGIWFTRHGHRAVLLLECADEEEAEWHLATLPLVRLGLITFETHALDPYDGLERLFVPGEKG